MTKDTQKTAPLSFHDPGTAYSKEDLPSVFKDLVEINNLDLAKFTPALFERSAKLGATHTLKLLNSAAQDAVLKLTPVTGATPRLFHTGDAASVPAGKILYRPIAIIGAVKARSLADHILNQDEFSETIFAAFADVFGAEAFEVVTTIISRPANFVESLHSALPVVYVPGPDGRELQLTPVISIETHAGMRAEFYPAQAEAGQPQRYGRVSRSEISSKPQNITGAIAPTHVRMLAEFPAAMSFREADIYRAAHGGRLPALPATEVKELIEAYVVQYTRLVAPKEGEQYIRFTEERMEVIADRIIDALVTHLGEIEELCSAINSDFITPEVSPISLLTGRIRVTDEEIALIGRALRGKNFQASLEKRGF